MEENWSCETSNFSGDCHESQRVPLLHAVTPQQNCRNSRVDTLASRWGRIKQTLSYILRFIFWTSGYNRHVSVFSKVYSLSILCVCWYQVVFEVARNLGYLDFSRYRNLTNSTKKLEYGSYLTSAFGTACSYTCMLICLKTLYKQGSNAISPYVALRDMGNSKAKIILITWLILTGLYIGFILMYIYIKVDNGISVHTKVLAKFISYFSSACEFLALWVAIVSMFAFSCSAFAIGELGLFQELYF